MAADAAGNLLIADTGNSAIRVIAAGTGTFYGQPMTAGDIYTIAGTGTAGYTGDGNPAARAELNGPQGLTVDGSGNVVVADTGNYRVRVVAAGTGTFYGKPMTAGRHLHRGRGQPHGADRRRRPGHRDPAQPSLRRRRWTPPGTWSSPTPATTGSG